MKGGGPSHVAVVDSDAVGPGIPDYIARLRTSLSDRICRFDHACRAIAPDELLHLRQDGGGLVESEELKYL